ncbi:MAG: TonB-dependent receptor [Calditrichaeota bacterium]|nr:MAG: TonB-dependent receptor [Calditrichota bacterium]
MGADISGFYFSLPGASSVFYGVFLKAHNILFIHIVLGWMHTLVPGICTAEGIIVRDSWNQQPVTGAWWVTPSGDSLAADTHGRISLRQFPATGRLYAPGYYSRILTVTDDDSLIFMEPVWFTEPITSVQNAQPSSGTASFNSRVTLTAAERLTLSQTDALLRRQAGLHIKSYGGEGGLQSISLRGMGAEQTQALLDDIPVNNMQLGMLDMGYMDPAMTDAVDILRGGSPILGSSGSIGGAVNFKLSPPADSLRLSFSGQMNSLANNRLFAGFTLPVRKLRQRLRLSHHWGRNRRTYNNIPLNNRDFNRYSLQWQALYPISEHQQIETLIHHFRSQAGAPRAFINASIESANKARISVNNTLARIRWRASFSTGSLQSQVYVRNEWMSYFDPVVTVNNVPLKSHHFNNEQGWISRVRYLPERDWLVTAGWDVRRQNMRSTNAGTHTRYSGALYGAVDKEWSHGWHTLFSLRQEFPNVRQTPVTLPTFSLRRVWDNGSAYLSYMRNFRVPAFNALYWQPGGNPALRPETSTGVESGLDFRMRRHAVTWAQNMAVYNTRVRDQIVWLPGADGIWRPQNIRQVAAFGAEWAHTLTFPDIHTQCTARLTYNRTVKNGSESAYDKTVGHLLPYHPEWRFYGKWASHWSGWSVETEYEFSSFAYASIANDDNNFLPSYYLLHATLIKSFHPDGWRFTAALSVKNILNSAWQTQKGYPMPGRYAGLAITINI